MNSSIFKILALLTTLSVSNVHSMIKSNYVDHAVTQYAGEIGQVAFGLGKKVSENYSFSILYGYVPKDIAGTEIETYAFKNNYSLFRFERLKTLFNFYTGINIYHVIGLKYQTSRHANYPRNYYRMSSIRALIYLGMNASIVNKQNKVFFESGINDFWIINYLNNSEVLDPKDYVSLALGWKHLF